MSGMVFHSLIWQTEPSVCLTLLWKLQLFFNSYQFDHQRLLNASFSNPSPCSSLGCPHLHLHSFSWSPHACLPPSSPSASPSLSPSLSACFALLLPACPLGFASARRQNSPYPPPLFKTRGMVEGSCSRDRSSVRVHFFLGACHFTNLPFPTLLSDGRGLIGITSMLLEPHFFPPLCLWKY